MTLPLAARPAPRGSQQPPGHQPHGDDLLGRLRHVLGGHAAHQPPRLAEPRCVLESWGRRERRSFRRKLTTRTSVWLSLLEHTGQLNAWLTSHGGYANGDVSARESVFVLRFLLVDVFLEKFFWRDVPSCHPFFPTIS